MSADIPVNLGGEPVLLLPERGIYRPADRTLVIADPHFGKAAAFRSGGIPVPGGTTAAMLRRLDAALARTGAARLLVLGDLLHARNGREPRMLDEVAAWRAARPNLAITLVRGNHDRHAGDPPAEWGVTCLDAPVVEPPLAWFHEPPDCGVMRVSAPGAYPIAGHVHPAVALNGGGRTLSLPCFFFGHDFGLLPAFGEFTGTALVRPRVGERVFVLAEAQIIEKR